MCDFFWQRLETADGQGDLADIVRASGGGGGGGGSSTIAGASSAPSSSTLGVDSWQQQQHLHIDQPAAAAAAAAAFPPLPVDDFSGGASLFGSLRDPLLHELAGTGGFFDGPTDGGSQGCGGGGGGSGDILAVQEVQMFADEAKRPCSNLFSRVLQISPNIKPLLQPSPGAIKPPPPPPTVADHSMQISSPCTSGIKRRKSQAKKVVCIPAPAAASNRPSGEVVPSDLWAWRKYGQKPIKGSPYPRGYYRCSSSKGCSARKQVERSRTDPNMLVITYTSEHNHPWPTQRNALAGSTRSQPTKNGGVASASKNSGHQNQRIGSSNMKEEPNDQSATASSGLAVVKEETAGNDAEKAAAGDRAFDQMLYGEGAMDHGSSLTSDDFFSDLAELDPDPMGLIFSGTDRGQEELKNKSKLALDHSFIDIFDWGGSSFGDQYQAKKGL